MLTMGRCLWMADPFSFVKGNQPSTSCPLSSWSTLNTHCRGEEAQLCIRDRAVRKALTETPGYPLATSHVGVLSWACGR